MWFSISPEAGENEGGKLCGWRMLPGLEESTCSTTPVGRTRTGAAELSWRENAADAGRAAEPGFDHVAVACFLPK